MTMVGPSRARGVKDRDVKARDVKDRDVKDRDDRGLADSAPADSDKGGDRVVLQVGDSAGLRGGLAALREDLAVRCGCRYSCGPCRNRIW